MKSNLSVNVILVCNRTHKSISTNNESKSAKLYHDEAVTEKSHGSLDASTETHTIPFKLNCGFVAPRCLRWKLRKAQIWEAAHVSANQIAFMQMPHAGANQSNRLYANIPREQGWKKKRRTKVCKWSYLSIKWSALEYNFCIMFACTGIWLLHSVDISVKK